MLRVGIGVGAGLALILVACSQPAGSGPTDGSDGPRSLPVSSTNAAIISGQVVDGDGHGIGAVMVIAVPASNAGLPRPPAAETGSDGQFAIGPIPGGRWHVAVMAGETEVASTDVDMPGIGGARVTIVMEGP
jgi:hypothetical protein